jgi:hypothetical protein
MENESEQEALFELQGPDEDGCVWACSTRGRNDWCEKLGHVSKVAEIMSQWLGSIDYDEVKAQEAPQPSRRQQERESKARRLADQTARRDRAAIVEEDEVDRMIRRNIEEHGA